MSASMLARQRKYRRLAAFRYAHDLLGVERLPAGVPAVVRGWVAELSDDEVQWGPDARGLAYLLGSYRRRPFLP